MITLSLLTAIAATACDESDHGDDHETEVISVIELSLSPLAGGEALVFSFEDLDGEGGASGTADTITLSQGTTYAMNVRFLNTLIDPAEDITEEVAEEAEDHQVFVFGAGVVGPASTSGTFLVSHEYADMESDYVDNATGDDLVVGLSNAIVAENVGDSELQLMLRHMPPVNGTPQKVAGLAEDLAADGIGALPGDVDVNVSFPLTVE